MAYELTFHQGNDFLHAVVTGTNSLEAVMNYLDDIFAECQRCDCYRVLIEERLDGPRLGTTEVFNIASDGSMKVLGVFEAIAYVDTRMGDMRTFAETVAVNRGMPVAAFASVPEAEAWLAEHRTAADEKRIFHDPGAGS